MKRPGRSVAFAATQALEKRGEAFEQASMIKELFCVSPSKNFGEKFTSMTAMDGFQPVGENGAKQNPVPRCGPWAFAFAPLQASSLSASPRF